MARNKHPGLCYQCGLYVLAGTGHFERHEGAWRTKHANVSGDGRITCEVAREALDAGTEFDKFVWDANEESRLMPEDSNEWEGK